MSDLFILRGVPDHIRSDNGPEFIAKAVREWIIVAVSKFGESQLSAMPAGAEYLDGVSRAAAYPLQHGRLSNHTMATVICHAGEARWS